MDRGGVYITASFLSGAITAMLADNLADNSSTNHSTTTLLILLTTIPVVSLFCLHIKQLMQHKRLIHIVLVCSTVFCTGYSGTLLSSDSRESTKKSVLALKTDSIREHIKEGFIKLLYRTISDPQDRAVVIAFTVGDKSYLSNTTKKAYQVSGAMHVLALSGLHIGIIYNLLNVILFFLNFCYCSKRIKFLICAACIFLYSAITGFGPSVMRASIMIILGKALSSSTRKYGKWDVFLLSACIIVMVNPQELADIGFQLSYAAVAGIIAIFPTINSALDILKKHSFYRYAKPVWSMIAISIACQISTAPLVLYYFHNIPFYFLITNLMVIPLVTISLYSTLFSLLTLKIPIISHISIYFSQEIIHLLNLIIKYIGNQH